jgi:hypothetical protein
MAAGAIAAGVGLMALGGAVGASARGVKGTKSKHSYYGGTKDELDVLRARNAAGVLEGAEQAGQGAGYLVGSVGEGNAVGAHGNKLWQTGGETDARGYRIGETGFTQAYGGMGEQRAAGGLLRDAAMGNAPSQAELMYQQQAGNIARQQQALAATARGGNQAAAMRSAGAEGRLAQTQALQGGAALRAAEMAQARGAYADAANAQVAAGQGVMQAGLAQRGLGLQQQGAAMDAYKFRAQNTQQAGQILGNLGAQREGQWLGAESDLNTAQLNAEVEVRKQRAEAQNRKKDRIFGASMSMIKGGANILGSASGGS